MCKTIVMGGEKELHHVPEGAEGAEGKECLHVLSSFTC